MTPQEKNKRVAEILGWTHVWGGDKEWFGIPPDGPNQIKLPNYCGSIEAAMGLVRPGQVFWVAKDVDDDWRACIWRDASEGPPVEYSSSTGVRASDAIVNTFLKANGVEV